MVIDMRAEMIDKGRGRYSRAAYGYLTIGRAYHHTAVAWLRPNATEADERNHVLMIDQYHYGKGWGGFGYNGIVFPSGRAYFCGDWDGARAHVSSRNHQLDGICFAGLMVGGVEPTEAALIGARELRALSVAAHGELPEAGHGAWALPAYPTSCPGTDYGEAWIPKIPTAGDGDEEDEVPTQAEYDALVAKVAKLEARTKDYVRFAGTNSIYEVVGDTLVGVPDWESYTDQAEDPVMERVVIERGTPEWARYTSNYRVTYRSMPPAMLVQTRPNDD